MGFSDKSQIYSEEEPSGSIGGVMVLNSNEIFLNLLTFMAPVGW